jgi:hypothetical protein
MRRLIPAWILALLIAAALAGPTSAAVTVFNVTLEPETAAPNASGHATITVHPEMGLICYVIRWKDVGAPVTGGHIHESITGTGGIVVSLFGGPLGDPTAYPGDRFVVRDCVEASQTDITAILANPSNYYVNLHIDPVQFTSVLRGDLD